MNRRYLAFDIEIAKVLPKGSQNWSAYRPLGISCAATYTGEAKSPGQGSPEGQPALWHGRTEDSEIGDQMSRAEAGQLVDFLIESARSGLTILTWNGLGFDFTVLAEESGRTRDCIELAFDHVDMMFHMFCHLGYALALDRAAKGMGLPGKPPGMRGELAPVYWAEGRRWEVLNYVAQDVRTTLDLARAADERRALHWLSKGGVRQQIPLTGGWLTVRQAMALPEPDTSWMSNPWPRSKFTGWLISENRP